MFRAGLIKIVGGGIIEEDGPAPGPEAGAVGVPVPVDREDAPRFDAAVPGGAGQDAVRVRRNRGHLKSPLPQQGVRVLVIEAHHVGDIPGGEMVRKPAHAAP